MVFGGNKRNGSLMMVGSVGQLNPWWNTELRDLVHPDKGEFRFEFKPNCYMHDKDAISLIHGSLDNAVYRSHKITRNETKARCTTEDVFCVCLDPALDLVSEDSLTETLRKTMPPPQNRQLYLPGRDES